MTGGPEGPSPRPGRGTHLIAAACAGFAPRGRRLEGRQARCIPRGPHWSTWPRAQVSCAWRRSLRATAGTAIRAWRAGEPQEGSGGVSGGWPARVGASPPAPRSAAGQLCLRRLAMCCVSISPCPSAKPPGAAARLTPSLPRSPKSPRPAAPRKGLQWLGRGPRSEGAGARLPIPPAPASGWRAQQRAGTGCRRSRALRAAGPLMPREEAGTK